MYGYEVDPAIYDRILEGHYPRLPEESRADWLERIAPERNAARVHRVEPGRLARSANAVPAKGDNDGD